MVSFLSNVAVVMLELVITFILQIIFSGPENSNKCPSEFSIA